MGRRPRRLRSRRGGAGYLFFCLIALPALFLSSALSIDTTYQIIAVNQVTSAVEAAARAGALEQVEGEAELHVDRARRVARRTFETARDRGVTFMAVDPQIVTPINVEVDTITVEVEFDSRLRTFMTYWLGDADVSTVNVVRSARVCTPRVTTQTAGFCGVPYAD